MNWLFSREIPLPAGLETIAVPSETIDLGRQRRAGLEALIGAEATESLARKLGPYQLGETEAKNLGLAGAKLGEDDEFPALTPARWERGAETWAEIQARLPAEGGEVRGLLLDPAQREEFLQFLARHRVKAVDELTPREAVALARHFFFRESLDIVVSYTGPRFHHA